MIALVKLLHIVPPSGEDPRATRNIRRARMAFTLHRAPDSMTILDNRGAKNLLCDGDLIFYRG